MTRARSGGGDGGIVVGLHHRYYSPANLSPRLSPTQAPPPPSSSGDSNARRISTGGAFVTFFKSLFGAGLLAVPNAFGRVGLPLGAIICLCVAAGCSVTCHILLRAREITQRRLEEEAYDDDDASSPPHPSGEVFVLPPHRRSSGGGDDDDTAKHHSPAATTEHHHRFRRHPHHHLVTYGDLADAVLGPTMASVTRWTIISLNVLFTAGLVIVIGENVSPLLPGVWDEEDPVAARRAVVVLIFPLIVGLLQIPWLQDMCAISALGLGVYAVGVIGSTIYSALGTFREQSGGGGGDFTGNGDGETMMVFGRGVPDDLWEYKWDGVPAFVGSAVYALEGVCLAMPTAHSMRIPQHADGVVTGGIALYGVVVVLFASMGYAGGLGGGPGTGLTVEECDVVTNCITPPELRTIIQVALSVAMLLGVPIMLYPATEMLEVMMTDWGEGREASRPTAVESEVSMVEYGRGGGGGSKTTAKRLTSKTNLIDAGGGGGLSPPRYDGVVCGDDDDNFADEEPIPHFHHHAPPAADDGYSQRKSWKLRVVLAALVVSLGLAGARSFTLFSGLVGAVGLTFAGFVLPVLIYVRATERAGLSVSLPMKATLAVLGMFGVVNMVVGGIGSLLELVRGLSGGV